MDGRSFCNAVGVWWTPMMYSLSIFRAGRLYGTPSDGGSGGRPLVFYEYL